MRAATAFLVRTLRAIKWLARDSRIPKPLRSVAALALLPIPGPFDEAVLLLVAIPLFVFYREPMHDAWHSVGAQHRRPARRADGRAAGS